MFKRKKDNDYEILFTEIKEEKSCSKRTLFFKKWLSAFNDFMVKILIGVCVFMLLIKGNIDSEVSGMIISILLLTFVMAKTELICEAETEKDNNSMDII